MFTGISGGGMYAIAGVMFGTVMLVKLMRTILHYIGLA